MNARVFTIVILMTAAIYAGFAVWLGVCPHALLEAFGIQQPTSAMMTEIRAFYGGVEIAIAVAMLLLLRRGDRFAALLIGGLPLACSALGRCLGLMLDGYSGLHAGFAVIEAVGGAVCLIGCLFVTKRAEDDSMAD